METCPFCITEVPYGATVCKGCGANKVRKPSSPLVILCMLGVLVFAGLTAIAKAYEHDLLKVFLGAIAFGLFLAPFFFLKKHDVWLRSNAR